MTMPMTMPMMRRFALLPVAALLFGLFTATPAAAQRAAPSVTATAGNAQVTVNWAITGDSGDWEIEYGTHPSGTLSKVTEFSGNARSRTITGLTNGTTYRFRVRGINASVTQWSGFVTATPAAPPRAGPTVTATVGHEQVTVNWAITGNSGDWEIEYGTHPSGTLSKVTVVFGGDRSWNITGLTNGTTYRFRVRGVGTNPTQWSGWVTATPLPSISLSANKTSVNEGDQVIFTVTLSSAATTDLSINVTLTAGTAEPGDYTGSSPLRVDFITGGTTGNFIVGANQDGDYDDETFTAALGTLPSGFVAGSTTSITITIDDDDTDPRPTLKFTEITLITQETDTNPLYVSVQLSAALATDSRVLITHRGSTSGGAIAASFPEDYTVSGLTDTGHLVLPAGQTTARFIFRAVADNINDEGLVPGNENVRFEMTAIEGAPYILAAPTSTEVVILDDSRDLWYGTLTPKSIQTNSSLGCRNAETAAASKCSTEATLTDDGFTLGDATFAITYLALANSNKDLDITFDSSIPDLLKGYTLHVGDKRFAMVNATISSDTATWSASGLTWTAGTEVQMKLARSVAPDPPKNLGVAPANLQLNAYWQPPDDPGEAEVTGYDVQYKESSAPDRVAVLWETTLDVDASTATTPYFGCDDDDASHDNCSTNLADNTFELNGVEYVVASLYIGGTEQELNIIFDKDIPSAFGDYSLRVGSGESFSLRNPTGSNFASWPQSSSLSWTDGQEVQVSLVAGGGGPADGWVDAGYSGTGIRAAIGETIWEATLTAAADGSAGGVNGVGCGGASVGACSSGLSPNGFAVGGTTYGVNGLRILASNGNLDLGLSTALPAEADGWALILDGETFNLSDATFYDSRFSVGWSGHGLSWSAGDIIEVELRRAGLVNDRAYDVRVRGVSSVGAGEWSGVVSRAPARQREVWSATLTSKEVGTDVQRGCGGSNATACATALTDNTFDAEGVAFVVRLVTLTNATSCGDDMMQPCSDHNALTFKADESLSRLARDYTLVVGDAQFSFVEGYDPLDQPELTWRLSGLSWSGWAAGQTVELKILKALVTPGVPAGLGVVAGDGVLTASWSAPADIGGSPVSGYDLHYKERVAADQAATVVGDPSTGWVDAGHSGVGTTVQIGGLTNLTQYEVRVRAVNTQGAGSWSDAVRAIPLPAGTIWAAKLVVADLGVGNFGCHFPGGPTSSLSCQNVGSPVIEDNDFALDGATYGVTAVSVHTGTLNFDISEAGPVFPAGIRAYVLSVGDAQFPFAGPDVVDADRQKQWSGGPAWTAGQVVQLQIKLGTVPTGLTLETTEGTINASWTAPSDPDFAVVDYDVEYKRAVAPDRAATVSGDAATGWVDTGHSGTDTNERIAGVTDYVEYDVRVRASDAEGPSFWSSPANARVLLTDQQVIWESNLTVGEVSFGLGHGRSASALGCGAPGDSRSGPVCSSALSAGRVVFRGSPVGVAYVNLGSGHYVHYGSDTLGHQDSGAGTLSLALESVLGEWMFLSLVADGKVFPLLTGESYNYEAVSGRAPQVFAWAGTGLGWSVGDTVDLALVYTPLLWMESTTNRPDRLGSFPMSVRETPPEGSIVDVRGKDPDSTAGAFYSLPIWISEPAPAGGLRVNLEVDAASTATAGVDYEWLNSYDPFIPVDQQAKVTTTPYVFFEEGETGYHRVFLRIIDDTHEDSGETIIVQPVAEGFDSRGMVITILNHDSGAPPGQTEAKPTSLTAEKTAAEKRERNKPKKPIPGKSDNARLGSLSLPHMGVLSPAFDPDIVDYRVHHTARQASHTAVLAKIRTQHPEATFTAPGYNTGVGWWALGTGYTFHEPVTFNITVTAADKYHTKTYTLTTSTDPVPPPPTPAVTVTPTMLNVAEGANATYTVALNARPSSDVTVAAFSAETKAVNVSPAWVAFTPTDWVVPRTFTVTAIADDDSNNETVAISHEVVSNDTKYNATITDTVKVSVTDTTPAPEQQTLEPEIAKPGPITELTLTTKPRNITITWQPPDADSGGAPNHYIVRIKCGTNARNRTINAPKTTTTFRNLKPGSTCNMWVRAKNNAGKSPRIHTTTTLPQPKPKQPEPAQPEPAQPEPASDQPAPDPEAPQQQVLLTEKGTVTLTPTALAVTEGSNTAYTVVLDARPKSDVTVTPASSDTDAVSVAPLVLTFTPADWDKPQTVTVTSLTDDNTNDETVTITHQTASSDTTYDAIVVDSVSVVVTDTSGPTDGRLEPFKIRVIPGDGTLTVTWIVSPRAGEADDDIHHALRWSQTPGVWGNPAGPRGHHNDGIVVWGGTATYTITGLTNGIATGVFVRSFTGTRTGEDSPHSSKWIRIKGPQTTPQNPAPEDP